jgi:hypothetical protein
LEDVIVAMIFPGMDPYLEDPQIWPGVHSRLIVYIADFLQPLLRPRYVAAIEQRVFVEGPDREIIPDVWLRRNQPTTGVQSVALLEEEAPVLVSVPELEFHESYINIIDLKSGRRIVTVIEVVSPTNKYAGPGRTSYLGKQTEVRKSQAHLVEIDLLRTGPHVLVVPEWAARGKAAYDYLACVNRAGETRRDFELYPRRLPQRLPRMLIPLSIGDSDVLLDLQAVLNQTYEAGSYRDTLNYDAPCVPPLSPADQAWSNERIQQARQATQP